MAEKVLVSTPIAAIVEELRRGARIVLVVEDQIGAMRELLSAGATRVDLRRARFKGRHEAT